MKQAEKQAREQARNEYIESRQEGAIARLSVLVEEPSDSLIEELSAFAELTEAVEPQTIARPDFARGIALISIAVALAIAFMMVV